MKKNIEKIVNYTLNILIVLFSIVLLITLYNSIQLKVFKNSYSNFFGYSVFEIQTNSMADEIFADDWIIVKITKNVDIGDVITFDDNGKFLTHRIIEKFGETYVTKGDANNSKDEPIDKGQIVGKVNTILPGFGTIRKTVFDKEVLLALIGFLFVLSFLFKKDKKELLESKEENSDLYNFDNDNNKESYLNKLTKTEKEEVKFVEQEKIDGETVEENEDDEIFSFYDEKKSIFKKKKDLKSEILIDEKEESKIDVNDNIDNNTDIVNIQDDENKKYQTVDDEIVETNLDVEVKEESLTIQEQIKKEEELNPDVSKLSIDLDESELQLIKEEKEEKEEEQINNDVGSNELISNNNLVINDMNNYDNSTDKSIITVVLDEVIEKKEEPKKKKKEKVEDIYKSVNQVIEIDTQDLEPIIQTNDTEITVYEDEIKRTEREINQYKNRISTINGQKDAIDLDIKTKHDKEIKDEQDRIEKAEFDRLEAKKLTHISLDNLSKRHYKTKNIIDKIMQLKILKTETFINLLNNGDEQKPNEPTIREGLEDTYNNVLFYNYFEVENNKKIDVELKYKAEKLIKNYKGNDKKFEEKVNKNLEYLLLISKLEMNNKKTTKEKNDYYKNELTKYSKGLNWSKEMIPYLIKEFKEIQSNHLESLESILKELDTKTFNLEFNKVNKNMLAVNLEHNVAFDKFYSDFVIDATYNSGVIKEDKMNVVIQLLMTTFLKNMLIGDFEKEYLLYLPNSLYNKKTKLTTLIKSINDKFVKEHSIITMSYEIFIKNRKKLREFKKIGYKFGVYIDFESGILEKHTKSFGLIDYIFIDPEQKDVVTKKIPNDYYERIILSDITKLLEDYEVKGDE